MLKLKLFKVEVDDDEVDAFVDVDDDAALINDDDGADGGGDSQC